MKTIKRTVLATILMFATMVNFANTTNDNDLNTKKVTITFDNVNVGHKLTVKNSDGVTLHTENVKRVGDLMKVIDFSKLENGNYTLELEKDFQVEVKSLKVTENNVIFDNTATKIIYKPVFRTEDYKVMISKIAFDKKPLKIALYHEGNVIFTETLSGDTILNRVYSLNDKVKGEYRIVMHNNGRSYTNTFSI